LKRRTDHLHRFWPWLIPVTALISAAGYVLWAWAQGHQGFPLDDAWIHQTYARNLAEAGQLAYLPGQPSAGSTSPAWSFLLSVGYLLGVDYRLWAYLLGALALAATAWLVYRLALRLTPSQPVAALLAGFLCAVEWHLVWAAASGMETILFTALSLALLEYFFSRLDERRSQQGPRTLHTERLLVGAIGIGLLSGVLILTRPEGLGLAGLVIVALPVLSRSRGKEAVKTQLLATGLSLAGLALLLAPYIAFNLHTAGTPFPNTFYAKQAEYQLPVSLPLRFWLVLSPTLVGAQVLLLPGFGYVAYRLVRGRDWPAVLPLVWWLAFLSVYALRLPVNYQHGRYSMPTIPLLLMYGTWGTALLLRPRSPSLVVRVLSRAAPAAIGLLALLFWLRGSLAYQQDVSFIDGEMVAAARWLDEHTASNDLIAVHDIGAVGYLAHRPLLDLAGLITPEVVPFIADADQLADWMLDHEAVYAVFFPDFSPTYAQLAADPRLQQVYCTGYAWTLSVGHKNLCVYRLSAGKSP